MIHVPETYVVSSHVLEGGLNLTDYVINKWAENILFTTEFPLTFTQLVISLVDTVGFQGAKIITRC